MSRRATLDNYRAMLAAGEEILCAICNLPIHIGGTPFLGFLTVDHIVPVKHNGGHHADNLQPAHAKCNSYRGHDINYQFTEKHAEKVFRAYAKVKDSLRHRWNPPVQLYPYLQRLKSAYDFFSSHPEQVLQEPRTTRLEWRWERLCVELCAYSWFREYNQGKQVPLEAGEAPL